MTSKRSICKRREPGALCKGDIRPLQTGGVASCNVQGFLRRIHAHHMRRCALRRNGEGDGAAARAKICDPHGGVRRNVREGALHDQFGFRPRNQHRGADLKEQRPEFLLPAYVCNGLALQPSFDELLKRPARVRGQLTLRMGAEIRARQPCHVFQEQLRIESWRCRRSRQHCRCGMQRVGNRLRRIESGHAVQQFV